MNCNDYQLSIALGMLYNISLAMKILFVKAGHRILVFSLIKRFVASFKFNHKLYGVKFEVVAKPWKGLKEGKKYL